MSDGRQLVAMRQLCRNHAVTRRRLLATREQRVNDAIRVREVRVIGDDGSQLGVMPTAQALDIAHGQGLDLVEVAPDAQPPVVRMLDFGKFKYEQAKREREGRKRQKGASLREIKMRPNIGRSDMDAKRKRATRFLQSGDKVKISVMFRGREITHREIGAERIEEMLEGLGDDGVPIVLEKPLSTEGRFMSVIVAADKAKVEARAREAEAVAAEAAQAAEATQAAEAAQEAAEAAPTS